MRAKTDLSAYSIGNYKIGANQVKNTLWYFINIVFFKNPLIPVSIIKVSLLKLFGAQIGRGVVIKPNVSIKYPWKLVIGDHSWIGENVWIDNLVKVSIGKNCCLSQGALILSGNHNFKKKTFDLIVKEIVLDDGVWIGAKSIVAPGVHCKSHSVLTVNSVATTKLDEYAIYRGNPAVKIKRREIED